MINILGIKRIFILLALFVTNAALALIVFYYLTPQIQTDERNMSTMRGEVSTLRADIDLMQVEFDQLAVQKDEFEILSADGFFTEQDRRQAELIFNDIQRKSGVSKAIVSIQPGVFEENEESLKAKHQILNSTIEANIEAVDDVNIFNYMFLIENYFPGHVSIEKIELKREANVSATVLRAISAGGNPPLVTAKLEMSWRTMIPAAQDADEGDENMWGVQ